MSTPTRPMFTDASEPAPWRVHVPPVAVPDRVHHDRHLILWQVRGETQLVLDDVDYQLTAGYALWVPAGVVHSCTVQANSVLLPMFFAVTRMATTLRQPTLVTVDRDLHTLFLAQIQTEYTIIQPAVNVARQILALVEESPVLSSALPMPTTETAWLVAETLRFNPGDDRGVEELAASVHASARTIERAFRAETGVTLRQWRIHNRMEAAWRPWPTGWDTRTPARSAGSSKGTSA